MPFNTLDLPSEQLKRNAKKNSEVFTPSLQRFQAQLNPAVATAFGIQPSLNQVPQDLPAPASVEAPPIQSVEPVGAPVQGSTFAPEPPTEMEQPPVIEPEGSFDDLPDYADEPGPDTETGSFEDLPDAVGATRPPSYEDEKTDEELIEDPFYVPAKAEAQRHIDGVIVTPDEHDRFKRIALEKKARGLDSGTVKAVLGKGLSMAPGVLMDFLKSFPVAGGNLWDTLAGETPEEKLKAYQTLLAGLDVGTGESSDLVANALGMKGIAGLYDQIKQKGWSGVIPGLRLNMAEQLKAASRFGPGTQFGLGKKIVEGVSGAIDPRSDEEIYMQDVGRYIERDKATRGEGIFAESMGLSKEEMDQLGIEVDPEEADLISFLADPANLIPVGAGAKGWQLVSKKSGKVFARAATEAGVQKARSRLLQLAERAGVKSKEAIQTGARKAVAGTLEGVGKQAAGAGNYMLKKVGGIAIAGGLAGAMFQGRPEYLAIGIAAALGSLGVRKMGQKMAEAGVKFAKGEGALEFIRRRAATGARGALHGFASTVPLAGLADDPEMAAGILASGSLGAVGALAGEAKAGARKSILTNLHRAWDSADVQGVNSPRYEARGDNAADVNAMNDEHDAQMARMGRQPNGSKAVGMINRLRETFRTVIHPQTGQAVPGRMWVISRKAFRNRFGADAHGAFVGFAPDGGMEIYLSEDPTGAHHEVGHLMDALMTNEDRALLRERVQESFGDSKIEDFRSMYESLLNQGLEPGETPVEVSKTQAVNEIIAEHLSLISRGNPLNGLPQDVVGQTREHVGRVLQRVFPSFRPEVAEGAQVVPGALLVEPSFDVVQAGRQAAVTSGLPTQPVETVAEAPVQPGPATPPPLPPAAPVTPIVSPAGSVSGVQVGTRPAQPAAPAAAPEGPVAPGQPSLAGVPVSITPRTPGVTPRLGNIPITTEEVENQRGKQTQTFAEGGRRDVKDVNDVQKILDEVESDPNFDPTQKAVLQTIAQAIREVGTDRGGPLVSLFYESVKPGGKESARRWARRAEQAMAYYQEQVLGETKDTTRRIFQKNTIPYRFSRTRNGKIQIIGMSPDKVLANATLMLNDLAGSKSGARRAILDWLPPEWEYAQNPDGTFAFTAKGLDAMASDLAVYSNNHANGFTGAGQRIRVPEGYQRYIPDANPGFTPTPLPASTATVLNALMGIAPPTTTTQRGQGAGRNPVTGQKITVPANVEAQILATENGLQPTIAYDVKFTKKEAKARGLSGVTPAEAGMLPEFNVPEYPGERFVISEMNPMRQQMQATGYNPKDAFTEAVERLNLDEIVLNEGSPTGGIDVKPTPIAEVSVPLATAGFLPRSEALQNANRISKMGPEEFGKWASTVDGGLTGEAYRTAISLAKDRDFVEPMFAEYQKAASKEAQTYLAQEDYTSALALGGKGQFFREASEVLGDRASMEGFSSKVGLKYPDLLMAHPKVDTVIEGIKSGEEFGQTLNADGTIFDPAKFTENDPNDAGKTRPEPLDVVTLASVNVPLAELTSERVRAELQPYVDALGFNRVKPGLFKLEKAGPQGQPMVSIDVNALVNQKHRANSVAFAAANNQESIYDLVKNEVIPTGGTGDTVVTDPGRIRSVAETVTGGKMPLEVKPEALTKEGKRFKTPEEMIEWIDRRIPTETPVNRQSLEAVKKILEDGKKTLFLPATRTDVETIKAAAVKSRVNGKVWTGPMHFAALQKAIQELNIGPVEMLRHFPDTFEDQGFVTSEGRYVNRRDGFEIAQKAQQVKDGGEASKFAGEEGRPSLQSEEVAMLPKRPISELVRTQDGVTRIIGAVDAYDKVSIPMSQDGREFHAGFGLGNQTRFAIKPVQKTVLWWEKPTDEQRIKVDDAIAKKLGQEGYAHKPYASDYLALPRQKPINLDKRPAVWILPDNKAKEVTSGRHENDLAENSKAYNKKYGTKFADTPQEIEGRQEALRKGFTRVRFERNNGRLNVEIPASRWPKVRGALEGLFLDNEDAVDNFRVSLVDTKPKTPKVLDYVDGNISYSQNRFDDFSKGLDSLRTRAGAQFLPADASIAAKRRAAKAEIQDHANRFPEAQPLQVLRDENNVPILDPKTGSLKYAATPYDLQGSEFGQRVQKELKNLPPRQRFVETNKRISEEIGRRLVEEYNGIKDERVKNLAKNWYKIASKIGKAIFGQDLVTFAQLLAATSPQTGVRENFIGALESYNRYKAGEYNELLSRGMDALEKFERGDPETIKPFIDEVKGATDPKKSETEVRSMFVNWFVKKNKLEPRKRSGKLFGFNSPHVAAVLLGEWEASDRGKKTTQFTKNLAGTDFGPTIDVWAMRAPHRLLNEGRAQWRIPFKNETSVNDVEYDVVADGYRAAAKELGMDPADLQAVVWFNEKRLWDEKGWTKGSGNKLASFVEFMEAVRQTPEGELVIQPEPGKELAGLDITPEEAEGFTVPPALTGVPTEGFGTPSLVEKNLGRKLKRMGVGGAAQKRNLAQLEMNL